MMFSCIVFVLNVNASLSASQEQTWKISKPAISRIPMKEAPCLCLRSRALLILWTSHRNRRSYVALASASTAKSACRSGRTRHTSHIIKTVCRHTHTANALKPYLLFGLGLLHILSTHFDPGSEDGPGELQHVDAEQMAQLLSSCVIRHGRLVVVLLLHKGNVPKLEHGRDHLKHGCREREGNVHQGRLCTQKNDPPPSFIYICSLLAWSPWLPWSPWSGWSSLNRSDQEQGWTHRWESDTHQHFLRAAPLKTKRQ